ncbi:MAG: carbohydrate ABC transporter permease [Psychromonas sp.]
MNKHKLSRVGMYLFLSLISLLSLFPFYWMVVSSTNTTTDINQGKITFGDQLLVNISKLSDQVDLGLIFWNTSKIAILSTLFTLLVASMAGYGFEVYKSRNRDRVYGALLLTMMIPFAALMIPLFTLMAKAQLLDTHLAVILPTIASVFIVFYFRQCTKAFPAELISAARVDGVKEWKIYFYIYMPVMKTTYAAAFIIVFMASWNAFLWPLIVLQSTDLKTINLVLSSLSSAYFPDFGMIMVGTVVATLPTLAVFFLMQKQFVAGMTGSVK